MKYYLKLTLNHEIIFDALQKSGAKKINFFIDLQSMCKGFYNKDVILMEIGRYITYQEPSNVLVDEIRDFLNGLHKLYKRFDPFFVIFYDDGFNLQNKTVLNSYKSGISTINLMLQDDQAELFREIKKYYFKTLPIVLEEGKRSELCKVFYLKEYESDFIPHYCIKTNLFDSGENDVFNVIFSYDKDLLQTTSYNNTVQYVSRLKKTPSGNKLSTHIYTDRNAISYIYDRFKPGILGAKYIPLILALAGDKQDGIDGFDHVGPKKAIDLIVTHKIPSELYKIRQHFEQLPEMLQKDYSKLERFLKLTDFNLQLERVNMDNIVLGAA